MKTGKKIWICIAGILLIALGIFCIANPGITLVNAAWFLGFMTLFTGISKLIFTFKTQAFMPNSGTRMLTALLDIFFGVFFLFHILGTAASLPFVFVIWVIIEGISVIVLSFEYKKVGFNYWWALLLMGIVGVVLGILALNKKMDVAAVTLSTLIGISVLLLGLAHILAVAGVNRFEKEVKNVVNQVNHSMNG